jgi:hypothetical protein
MTYKLPPRKEFEKALSTLSDQDKSAIKECYLKELKTVKNVDDLGKVYFDINDELKEEFNNTLDKLGYSLEDNHLYFLYMINCYSYNGNSRNKFKVGFAELKGVLSKFKANYTYVLVNTDTVYPNEVLNYGVKEPSDKTEDNFATMLDEIIEKFKQKRY